MEYSSISEEGAMPFAARISWTRSLVTTRLLFPVRHLAVSLFALDPGDLDPGEDPTCSCVVIAGRG